MSVAQQIRALSTLLAGECGSTPPATDSKHSEVLADANAVVSLLTVTSPQDKMAECVVAATGCLKPEGIGLILVARHPVRQGDPPQRVEEGLPCSDQPIKVILDSWSNPAPVSWEIYAGQILKLINCWSEEGVEGLEGTTENLHYFVFRHCRGKLAARMLLGEKLWACPGGVFKFIHDYLTSAETKSRFTPFEVRVRGEFGKTALQNCGINATSTSPPTYPVNSDNVATWFEILKRRYSTLRRCLINDDHTKEEANMTSQEIETGTMALLFIYDLVSSHLVAGIIKALPKLSRALRCARLIGSKMLSDDDFDELDRVGPGFPVADHLDQYLTTLTSPFWAIQHLSKRYFSATHGLITAQVINMSTSPEVQDEDYEALQKHIQSLPDSDPTRKAILEWLEDRLEQNFRKYANQHVEAVLMDLVSTPEFSLKFGEMVPIASGGRHCYCCSMLATFLQDTRRIGELPNIPEFISLGTHGIIYGWEPPAGVPVPILEQLRDDLFDVMTDVAQRYRPPTPPPGMAEWASKVVI